MYRSDTESCVSLRQSFKTSENGFEMGLINLRLCFEVSDQTLNLSLFLQNTSQIRIRVLSKVCIKFIS